MKYGTSLRVRHIVGRFEKGEELLESVRRLCTRERIRAATISAIGVLTSGELQRFEPSSRAWVTCFQGELPLDIVHLSGNVSTLGSEVIVNLSAELAYSSYGQRHIVGGHLATAKVFSCEFQLCAYDDLLLERTFDAATGLPLWNRIGGAELAEMVGSDAAAPRTARVSAEPAAAASSAPAASESYTAAAAAPKREPEIIHRRPAVPEPVEDDDLDDLDDLEDDDDLDGFDDDDESLDDLDEDITEEVASRAHSSQDDDDDDDDDDANTRPASKSAWATAIEQAGDESPATRSTGAASPKLPDRPRRPAADEFLDEEEDEIFVEPGDILLHPTLGECMVARVDDDESAYIRVGNKRPRKFALHMFDLEPAGERNGRNVYQLVKKAQRARRGAR